MGHAHHFLSRLDRVSLPHVELALSLYRDDGLLRLVLNHARIPERAERVAISLGDARDGPFVVVTRGGRFVTCLGAGMSPGETHVVTRQQLDGAASRLNELRHRTHTAERLQARGGRSRSLITRVIDAGSDVSREEFIAISAMQPLLIGTFWELLTLVVQDLQDWYPNTRRLVGAVRLKHRQEMRLHAFWKLTWAAGHLGVLACMDDARHLLGTLKTHPDSAGKLSLNLSWLGFSPVALRGFWCVASLGKLLLPGYKRALSTAVTYPGIIDAICGLIALASRQSKLHAEVRKALTPSAVPPTDEKARVRENFLGGLQRAFDLVLDRPDEARTVLKRVGAQHIVNMGKRAPPNARHRYPRVEDVPDAHAYVTSANLPDNFHRGGDSLVHVFMALPWVARSRPEELYIPSGLNRILRRPWEPDDTFMILRDMEKVYLRRSPIRVPEAPGRNNDCPCGSGRKFKKCCMRTSPAAPAPAAAPPEKHEGAEDGEE